MDGVQPRGLTGRISSAPMWCRAIQHRPEVLWRAVGVLAVACAMGLATGCSSTATTGSEVALGADASDAEDGAGASVLTPGIVGSQSGLEVQWWVVDDPESFVGAALAKYGAHTESDLDEATRDLWWSNGLRVLAIPLDDLARVKSRLDVGAVGHVQWLGLLPTWTQIVVGPEFKGRRAINLDSGEAGRVVLDGGKMRLLARCWTAPAGDGKPTIRLELMPQHVEPDVAKRREMASIESKPWGIEDEGLVFTRLRAGWSADGSVAYLIVPEAPVTDWEKVAERSEQSAAAREREQNIASATRVGPFEGSIPSVGEAMLTSALSDPEGRIGKRIVIVLVPRMPERFELIAE